MSFLNRYLYWLKEKIYFQVRKTQTYKTVFAMLYLQYWFLSKLATPIRSTWKWLFTVLSYLSINGINPQTQMTDWRIFFGSVRLRSQTLFFDPFRLLVWIALILVGKNWPTLATPSQDISTAGTWALIDSINSEAPGAPPIKPITLILESWRALHRQASAPLDNSTSVAGADDNAKDAVLIRTGKWAWMSEDCSAWVIKTATSGRCSLSNSPDDMPSSGVNKEPLRVVSSSSRKKVQGKLLCASVSKYRVVELKPIVTEFWISGLARWVRLAENDPSVQSSLCFVRFLFLLPSEQTILLDR